MNKLTKAALTILDRPTDQILGQIILDHNKNMAALEKMIKSETGRTKLMAIVQRERLSNDHYELLMNMGAISRAAQLSTTINYEFTSSVGLSLPAIARTVDMYDAPRRNIAGQLTDGSG